MQDWPPVKGGGMSDEELVWLSINAIHANPARFQEAFAAFSRIIARIAELEKRSNQFQTERAELFDKLHGTPCADIRWQQEREKLQMRIAELKKELNACVYAKEISDNHINELRYKIANLEAAKKGK